jgi:Concanavalin A-like lectin/glucanases superfamily
MFDVDMAGFAISLSLMKFNTLVYCSVIFSLAPHRAAVAALVAQYGFEEGSGAIAGDSALTDGTTNPNDTGTIIGATHSQGVVGNFALSLDGISDYIDLEFGGLDNDILGSAAAVTFSSWLRLDSYPSDVASIIFFSVPFNSLNSRGGMFISRDGFVEVAGRASDTDSFQSRISTTKLPLNAWVHVAGILDYSNEEVEIYIDGSLQPLAAGSVNFSATSTPATLSGASTLGSTGGLFEFYHGSMDDVRIYNERLNGSEIAVLIPETSSIFLVAISAILVLRRERQVIKTLVN